MKPGGAARSRAARPSPGRARRRSHRPRGPRDPRPAAGGRARRHVAGRAVTGPSRAAPGRGLGMKAAIQPARRPVTHVPHPRTMPGRCGALTPAARSGASRARPRQVHGRQLVGLKRELQPACLQGERPPRHPPETGPSRSASGGPREGQGRLQVARPGWPEVLSTRTISPSCSGCRALTITRAGVTSTRPGAGGHARHARPRRPCRPPARAIQVAPRLARHAGRLPAPSSGRQHWSRRAPPAPGREGSAPPAPGMGHGLQFAPGQLSHRAEQGQGQRRRPASDAVRPARRGGQELVLEQPVAEQGTTPPAAAGIDEVWCGAVRAGRSTPRPWRPAPRSHLHRPRDHAEGRPASRRLARPARSTSARSRWSRTVLSTRWRPPCGSRRVTQLHRHRRRRAAAGPVGGQGHLQIELQLQLQAAAPGPGLEHAGGREPGP